MTTTNNTLKSSLLLFAMINNLIIKPPYIYDNYAESHKNFIKTTLNEFNLPQTSTEIAPNGVCLAVGIEVEGSLEYFSSEIFTKAALRLNLDQLKKTKTAKDFKDTDKFAKRLELYFNTHKLGFYQTLKEKFFDNEKILNAKMLKNLKSTETEEIDLEEENDDAKLSDDWEEAIKELSEAQTIFQKHESLLQNYDSIEEIEEKAEKNTAMQKEFLSELQKSSFEEIKETSANEKILSSENILDSIQENKNAIFGSSTSFISSYLTQAESKLFIYWIGSVRALILRPVPLVEGGFHYVPVFQNFYSQSGKNPSNLLKLSNWSGSGSEEKGTVASVAVKNQDVILLGNKGIFDNLHLSLIAALATYGISKLQNLGADAAKRESKNIVQKILKDYLDNISSVNPAIKTPNNEAELLLQTFTPLYQYSEANPVDFISNESLTTDSFKNCYLWEIAYVQILNKQTDNLLSKCATKVTKNLGSILNADINLVTENFKGENISNLLIMATRIIYYLTPFFEHFNKNFNDFKNLADSYNSQEEKEETLAKLEEELKKNNQEISDYEKEHFKSSNYGMHKYQNKVHLMAEGEKLSDHTHLSQVYSDIGGKKSNIEAKGEAQKKAEKQTIEVNKKYQDLQNKIESKKSQIAKAKEDKLAITKQIKTQEEEFKVKSQQLELSLNDFILEAKQFEEQEFLAIAKNIAKEINIYFPEKKLLENKPSAKFFPRHLITPNSIQRAVDFNKIPFLFEHSIKRESLIASATVLVEPSEKNFNTINAEKDYSSGIGAATLRAIIAIKKDYEKLLHADERNII